MTPRTLAALPALLLFCACPTDPVDDDDSAVPVDDDDDDTTGGLPDSPFAVRVVVLEDGEPLAGAVALQGGSTDHVPVDGQGEAVVTIDPTIEGEIWVIAAAAGRRSVGEMLLDVPDGDVVLELVPVEVDNIDYEFQPAGVGKGQSTEWCSHCHVTFVEQFGTSTHFEAARDEQVHDVYAGTAAAFDDADSCTDAGGLWRAGSTPGTGEATERCYLGHGLLPDSTGTCGGAEELACDDPDLPEAWRPVATGGCADCHAPAIQADTTGGHDLLEATGIAYDEGVTCDLCHKVRAVDVEADAGGLGGRLLLGRPLEEGSATNPFRPVMYGPYADVLNGGMLGSWAPVFGSAELCSGCHEHSQAPLWDDPALVPDPARWPDGTLPVLSTYSEWLASSLSPGSPCQECHMPPMVAANSADLELFELEPGAVGGFLRDDGQVRDHSFYGPLEPRQLGPRLLDTAGGVLIEGSIDGAEVVVDAEMTNLQTGHALPTGKALRRVLLAVEARCDGELLPQTAGGTISELGGALATGVVGEDVTVGDATIFWSGLPDGPEPSSLRLRAVRPTGAWVDYQGFGPFRDPSWTAEDKGLPEVLPLGEVAVTDLGPGTLVPADVLPLTDGDVLHLGEAAGMPSEGDPSLALAGSPGWDWGRVLADADGATQVPHHRAVDVVRDNRLLPYETATTQHRFALPDGCAQVTASARLVYRRYPLGLARERGWELLDHVFGSADIVVSE